MEREPAALHKVYEKPSLLLSGQHSLCAGCGEPLALRTILEVIAALGCRDTTISVCGIGCYTAFPKLIDVDVIQALHGRAPSVATGAKRMLPGHLVWTLQGDGDMVSEGLQEVLHAAARREKITCVLLNNTVFGETGGHMTSTSIVGQKTKSTLGGRDAESQGEPIKLAELIAAISGSAYVARGSVHSPVAIGRTKRMLRRAFETQLAGQGFSLVEIITMCPSGWFMEPWEGPQYVQDTLLPVFPLGELKTP